jgi:hypothetical protein
MKGKKSLFIFALKRNEKYGRETKQNENNRSEKKRKEKNGSETKRKEKFMKQNIYAIFCLEAKRKIGNELSEKKRTNLCEIFA